MFLNVLTGTTLCLLLVAVQCSAAPQPVWTECPVNASQQWAELEAPLREAAKLECGILHVPLDYTAPGGASLSIAFSRVTPRNAKNSTPPVFLNPGGPGTEGLALPIGVYQSFGDANLVPLTWVGFDPRGVGQSSKFACLTATRRESIITQEADFSTAQGIAAARLAQHQANLECARSAGASRYHYTTANTARDMDQLRQALAYPMINYLGTSYGTFLGETYASMFPRHAAALVLDAPIDLRRDLLYLADQTMTAQDRLLQDFMVWCDKTGRCTQTLGMDVRSGLMRFFDSEAKLPGQSNIRNALVAGLAEGSDDNYTLLLDAVSLAQQGQKQLLQTLASASGSASTDDDIYRAIVCNEFNGASLSNAEASALSKHMRSRRSYLGRTSLAAEAGSILFMCEGWGKPKAMDRHGFRRKRNGKNVLIIGARRDFATPMAYAEDAAKRIKGSVLVTVEAGGHGQLGNPCVSQPALRLLTAGKNLARPLTCRAAEN